MLGRRRPRYRLLRSEDDIDSMATDPEVDASTRKSTDNDEGSASLRNDPKCPWWSRERYYGALLFNVFSFILPAIYATLAKLWIAEIDSSMVATTDTYTYIGVVVEVINEGLPRAAYKVIGDKSRRSLALRIGIANTTIIFQAALGLIMSCAIFGAAERFTRAFVPRETREESLQYVRIATFSAVFSAIDVAVSACTRVLDRPDVPLLISSIKTLANIILDLVFLSRYRVKSIDVDVNTQVIIKLCCDAAGALAGVLYYLYVSRLLPKRPLNDDHPLAPSSTRRPTLKGWMLMAKPGAYTFTESAVRNALYLWLVSGIVDMGANWATAWGVFNTIRWGLIMVPIYALEATSATFVGHSWGHWKSLSPPRNSRRHIYRIVKPALTSVLMAVTIEVPICLFMTFAACRPFARYLSGSAEVADITQHMWRTIDWCYIFYAVNTQLASILLATRPRWYLGQSLGANILWVLPWAAAIGKIENNGEWRYYAIIFGGSMVVSFVMVNVALAGWWWRVWKKGR